MFHRFLLAVLMLPAWVGNTEALAQRVQFPSAAPTYAAPAPTYVAPAPNYAPTPQPVLPGLGASSFDPYGNPLLGTPPADVPYNVSPQLGQPILPQANSLAAPATPQQGTSLFPGGLPFQYESGAYQHQNTDGNFARMQRLLQQISFEHTWLYGGTGIDKLEINRTEFSATFGIPIFYNPDTPLLLTPGFAFNWLTGPRNGGAGLPPRVYDAYLDSAWHPRLTDWLRADLGLRTGVWTDFDVVNSDSLRILGRGLGVLAFTPQLDFLVGAWYLDRNRVKLLPAGGMHWRPSATWDLYLVFPNPKIRKRSVNIGSSQWWIYFAGEYGGGRWTVARPMGASDDIDYNDIRVVYGIEWETQTQARGHIEVGYVFDREILYDLSSAPSKLNLNDTVMVRAGVDF
ncbi:MAG: hypothetical protein MK171_10895 [Pirellulales bacterium]|nr:hypothetical protein [Pirellulales bacterium]